MKYNSISVNIVTLDNCKLQDDESTASRFEEQDEGDVSQPLFDAMSPASATSTVASTVESRFLNRDSGLDASGKARLIVDFLDTAKKPVTYKLGQKGQVIVHQVNPRKFKSLESYEQEFFGKVFNGDSEKGRRFIDTFKSINAHDTARANGLLTTVIAAGVNQRLLSKLFGIGCNRFNTIKEYGSKPRKTSYNPNKVTTEQLAMMQVCRDAIPVDDEGFACNHRCQMQYIGDPDMTSIEKIYQKYYVVDTFGVKGKRMALPTFRKYWATFHSDLRFKQLKEDECDTCIELNLALTDANLSIKEKERIRGLLSMHRNVAKELRIGMREAIKIYANNFIGDNIDESGRESLNRSVDRIPLFSDESITETTEESLAASKVWLMCQDFAGNFPLPFYGAERPGKDYYLSNLATYVFVASDLSRNRNNIYIYDERGMGKDGNAMCSLRLKLFLDSINQTKDQSCQRPKVLMIILDNCVGQNKSQVIIDFLIQINTNNRNFSGKRDKFLIRGTNP